jgi:hypothetical protein
MYERFLPKFKVVEINLSTAHLIGHVVAQTPAYVEANETKGVTSADLIASVNKSDNLFVENGIIVGLDAKGLLVNYDATKHSQPCLVYNDELITGPFDNLDQYAHYVGEKGKTAETYVRALPLYLNDSFTTNNFSGEAADGYAKVVNGVLTLEENVSVDTLFIAKKTTMPNREVGVEFTYIGKVKA